MDCSAFNVLVEKMRTSGSGVTTGYRESKHIRKRKIRISSLCERYGITIQNLADILGVSVDPVSEWGFGASEPAGSAKHLLWIAQRYPEVILESLWEY